MAVIKQISVFDGSSWGTDDIGANAANIDFANSVGTTASIAGSSNLYTGLSNILPASKLTASRALVTGSDQKLAASNVTATQLGYLSGASSSIQTQINTLNTNLAKKVSFNNTVNSSSVSTLLSNNQYIRLSVTGSDGNTYMLYTDSNGLHLWDAQNQDNYWNLWSVMTDLVQIGSTGIWWRAYKGTTCVLGSGLSPSTSWTTIATLPAGSRPFQKLNFAGMCGSNGNTHMAVNISTNGDVKISAPTASSGNGYFWTCYPRNST